MLGQVPGMLSGEGSVGLSRSETPSRSRQLHDSAKLRELVFTFHKPRLLKM